MALIYPAGDSQETVNLGLSTNGMDEVLAENMILIDAAIGSGAGSVIQTPQFGAAAINPNDASVNVAIAVGQTVVAMAINQGAAPGGLIDSGGNIYTQWSTTQTINGTEVSFWVCASATSVASSVSFPPGAGTAQALEVAVYTHATSVSLSSLVVLATTNSASNLIRPGPTPVGALSRLVSFYLWGPSAQTITIGVQRAVFFEASGYPFLANASGGFAIIDTIGSSPSGSEVNALGMNTASGHQAWIVGALELLGPQ